MSQYKNIFIALLVAILGVFLNATSVYGRVIIDDDDDNNLPAAPSSISVPSSNSSGSYTVSWKRVLGHTISRYELYEKKNTSSWIKVFSGLNLQASYSNKEEATYQYRVRACTVYGCGDYRTSNSFVVLARPGTPSSITVPASNSTGAFSVSWGAASGIVKYYELYELNHNCSVTKTLVDESNDDNCTENIWRKIYSGYSLSQSLSGKDNGDYSYKVRGCNDSGCGSYRTSSTLTVLLVPAAPNSITTSATQSSTGDFTISWSAATGIVSEYQLFEKVSGGTWETTPIFSGAGLSFSVANSSSGTFDYRVRACNSSGCSAYKELPGTVFVDRAPEQAPSISAPTLSKTGNFKVSWSKVNGASYYKLYNGVSCTSIDCDITTTTARQSPVPSTDPTNLLYQGASLEYSVSLVESASYSYKVMACNSLDVCSDSSTTVTTLVQLSFPGRPEPISVPTESQSGTYVVSWSEPQDGEQDVVDSYNLEELNLTTDTWNTIYSGKELSKSIQKEFRGEYQYRVQACNQFGCGLHALSSIVKITKLHTTPEPAPAPHLEPIPEADPLSEKVGTTKGQFRVNESGAMTYSIPLTIPAGTAGVSPQLSFNYSSQSGNGVMGLGWSIGGLSGITRCRQTYEQDQNSAAVKFSYSDRYCLDGQRLMAIDGGDGGDGTEYRTEIDQYARIISYGSSNDGPAYFKVWRKDGTVHEYGNTDSSQINANLTKSNNVISWLLNRTSDNLGNYIDYEYLEDVVTGEVVIDRIDYTGKEGEGSHLPYNHLQFVYTTSRPDKNTTYFGGAQRKLTKRLVKVNAFDTGRMTRSYHLTYGESPYTNLSRLVSVEECSDDSKAVCYLPITFEWQERKLTMGTAATGPLTMPSYLSNAKILRAIPSDLDANGRQDLIYLTGDSDSGYYQFSVFALHAKQESDGREVVRSIGSIPVQFPADINLPAEPQAKAFANSLRSLDLNGDGLFDYAYLKNGYWTFALTKLSANGNPSVGEYKTAFSNGLPTRNYEEDAIAAQSTHFIDFGGDGFADVIYPFNDSVWVRHQILNQSNELELSSPQRIEFKFSQYETADSITIDSKSMPKTGDFNGDGKMDLIAKVTKKYLQEGREIVEQKWTVFVSDGKQSATEWNDSIHYLTTDFDDIRVVDINADGLSDIAYKVIDTWYARLSTGAVLGASITIGDVSDDDQLLQFHDYNQDGFKDLIYPNGGVSWRVRFWDSNSETFSSTEEVTHISAGDVSVDTNVFLDMTGDGAVDHIHLETEEDSFELRSASWPNKVMDKIISIDNGLDADIEVDYKPLTDTNIYERGSTGWSECWWRCSPIIEFVAPVYVVSETRQDSPAADNYISGQVDNTVQQRTSYFYKEARLQGGSRGFLGFREVAALNHQTNIKISTRYRQDFPFTGLPEETKVVLTNVGNDILLGHSINTWQGFDGHSQGFEQPIEKVLRPQLAATEEHDYDINGVKRKSITTAFEYDLVGNVTRQEVTTFDGFGLYVANNILTNTYSDDLDKWYLGRLTRAHAKHMRAGSNSVTKESTFSYDSSTGLLMSAISEPNGSESESLKTVYQYDAYGNKIRTTDCSIHVIQCGVDSTQNPSNALHINRYEITTFDDKGRHVIRTENSKGHSELSVISLGKFGVTKSENISGIVTDIEYDRMGSAFFTRTSAGSFSIVKRRLCAEVSCPTGAAYYSTESSGASPEATRYFDKLGREIRTSGQAFDGRLIHVDTEYDINGQVKRKSEPYFTGESKYWTTFSYDVLGRLTATQFADGSQTSVTYNLNSTEYINDLGQRRLEEFNALEEMIRVTDSMNGSISFQYDTLGNAIETTDVSGNKILAEFDKLGRKTWLNDPDRGLWSFKYNALGEQVEQEDANQQLTRHYYDGLGRIVRKVELDSNGNIQSDVQSIYDGVNLSSRGKLIQESDAVSSFNKIMTYDDLGRLHSVETQIASQSYIEQTTYDEFGRKFQYFEPTGNNQIIRFRYNAIGYLAKQENELSGKEYLTINQMDARGNVISQTSGNGLVTERYFDNATGRLASIVTGEGAIQNLNYQYDSIGNLLFKEDYSGTKQLSESFTYDNLNRLTSAQTSDGSLQNFEYDALGNIVFKSGVGSYSYGNNAGPHAVTQVSGEDGLINYHYDANGNLVQDNNRTLSYTVFNKPDVISNGEHSTEFNYAPDQSRYQRKDINSDGTTTRHYIGNAEIIFNADGSRKHKRFIANAVVTHLFDNADNLASTQHRYIHTDSLGSVDVVTDENLSIVEQLSFDAFGSRRNANNWQELSADELAGFTLDSYVLNQGYTGHEQLDELGLIHMNGRVYDPTLGRFLQADPFIQEPSNTQSYNRYSYVLNNPLKYTDPTGYLSEQQWRKLAAVAIKIVGYIFAKPTGGASVILAGALAGYVETGTSEGAMWGAAFATMSVAVDGVLETESFLKAWTRHC